jgi:histidine ammonia-lyase
MVMKIVALARGCSGVRPELIDALCSFVNHDIYPVVPSKGSVGASGDLAPLAHMAGILIGDGEASCNGEIISGSEALDRAGLRPMEFAPKEGLALLNGTQVSTALALAALFRTEHILSAYVVAGAMSADAVKGSDTPFDERVHLARGHRGQLEIGRLLRDLMRGSDIRASHLSCNRVQDPYSIRCQPQVIGACLGVLQHAAEVLQIEANAVTDNPLVFADPGEILSGGNFHAEPVALVADYLALSIAEIGSLSERRIALLIDSNLSELPAFLVEDGGLNSGFMMAQVTAAALASENKSMAHPASVDSIPTSANQEDHVSMATFAARRLHDMLDNVAYIVAIELMAAGQGIEFHRPLKSSEPLENALTQIRAISARYAEDRSLSGEIEALSVTVDDGAFCDDARSILPSMST